MESFNLDKHLRELRGDRWTEHESDLFHPATTERFWVFSGLPGVGKTYQMIQDLRSVVDQGWAKTFDVISQTNYAVKNAGKDIFEKEMPKGVCIQARTLHKLIWGALTPLRVAGLAPPAAFQIGPSKSKRPAYLTNVLDVTDRKMRERYVKDAPSGESDDSKITQKLFSEYDPWVDGLPDPKMLGDVPRACRFDQSLLHYLLATESAPSRWEKFVLGPEVILEYRPWIFVDEFQDFTPLQAAALIRYADINGAVVRLYGDPNQAMATNRRLPKLLEIAEKCGKVTPIFGSPGFRRCPYPIAEVAHKILPDVCPVPELWANNGSKGRVVTVTCPNSEKIRVARGFSIGESRWAVATSIKFAATHQYVFSPEGLPEGETDIPVFATAFGVKGYEADVVTIQRWKPKHMEAYRRGEPEARRRMFVAVSRSKGTLVIHREMLDMIEECYRAA